jgi:hypothetical protein
MRINHYVSSWEYPKYRFNDGRQGAIKNHNSTGAHFSNEDRLWVNVFVRLIGEMEPSDCWPLPASPPIQRSTTPIERLRAN